MAHLAFCIRTHDATCLSSMKREWGRRDWQRDHFECKGNLYCKVGINTNYTDKQAPDRWIWKADCGAESRTEAEKREASDSLKSIVSIRGIGRGLYTAPPIFIKSTAKDGNANF